MESFVGAKVKSIRVTDYQPRPGSAKRAPVSNPLELQQEVRQVWLGKFRGADCQISWAEWVRWNIKAIVDFEDGNSGSLMTDGLHVQVRDRREVLVYALTSCC